jgi:pimeloyl-ACP methyl ester carboxylesterase
MVRNRLPVNLSLFCVLALAPLVSAADLEPLRELRVTSTLDGSEQPSRIWTPDQADGKPIPVLVSLHTWSSGYEQDRSDWVREAQTRGWIYLQPDFRGPNDHPQACGSALARQDIIDALDQVLDHYSVDETRIYLAGVSGGGHMTMLMSGYYPDRFSAATVWVGISDLAAWYDYHLKDGEPDNYARMTAASCGGAPGDSAAVDAEYRSRSPIHHLAGIGDLFIDLNAGVHDGKTGSVPIMHTLNAFNAIAEANGHAVIPESQIQELWRDGRLSMPTASDGAGDPSYPRDIYLRRTAGNARVTIFEGGHEELPTTACAWLERQHRPTKRPDRE